MTQLSEDLKEMREEFGNFLGKVEEHDKTLEELELYFKKLEEELK